MYCLSMNSVGVINWSNLYLSLIRASVIGVGPNVSLMCCLSLSTLVLLYLNMGEMEMKSMLVIGSWLSSVQVSQSENDIEWEDIKEVVDHCFLSLSIVAWVVFGLLGRLLMFWESFIKEVISVGVFVITLDGTLMMGCWVIQSSKGNPWVFDVSFHSSRVFKADGWSVLTMSLKSFGMPSCRFCVTRF